MARPYYEKSAYLGYYKAQFQMGQVYAWGLLNCPKDLAKSFHYYHLAVRRGSVEAAEALSIWFYTGAKGLLLPDPELSFKFAQRGAVEGKSGAEYILGCHYETAEYVEQDLNKAREWHELAMSHNSSFGSSSDIRSRAHARLALLKPRSLPFGESSSKSVGRSLSEAVTKPKTIMVGIDLGAVFSSVSWADSSNPYEIYSIRYWPHAAADLASDAQVPTQYDLETKVWGNPRSQAARLRKSVDEPQKNCFSALEDFCSSVEPTCKQAAGFLTSYIRSLWSHAVREIFSRTQLWDLAFMLSLAIPVYFSSDAKNRLLRVAYDATVQNDASQVVEINVVGQMQAAILNPLKAQYRLDRSARGPSIVMENAEIVVVCDCGGTGARAISYEVHTESPPLVRQLTAWNGERIGTHAVDMEFLNYLLNHSSSNLGTSRSALAELDFFIQTEWEYGLKRTFRGDENHDIVLQLPRKAISTLRRLQPSSNKLSIKPNVVRKCFEKSLMAIEKVIDAQFTALEAIGRKPNSILLVGGLAQSPYIIQHLQ
ncbi:Hsp70 chaperone protein [Fusarium bulbicola]|nr:Hsp70 chaperone protein [Fusarium bulbicola]